MRSLVLLLALLLTAPAAAQDTSTTLVDEEEEDRQIYGYVDSRGAWHFVDSLALVPVAYRNQARANAMRVDVLTTEPKAKPEVTRRTLTRDEQPEETRRTLTEQEEDRRRRIAELRARRTRLMESVAALEEGSAPAELVPEGDVEALTEERLEEFLTDTEAQLETVERELRLLGALR